MPGKRKNKPAASCICGRLGTNANSTWLFAPVQASLLTRGVFAHSGLPGTFQWRNMLWALPLQRRDRGELIVPSSLFGRP